MAADQKTTCSSKLGHVIPQQVRGEIRNFAVHFPTKKPADRICFVPPAGREVADALLLLCQRQGGKSQSDLQKLCADKKKLWLKHGVPVEDQTGAAWPSKRCFCGIKQKLGGPERLCMFRQASIYMQRYLRKNTTWVKSS